MLRGLLAFGAIGAIGTTACGGGAVLEVVGARFSVSPREAEIAHDYERQEPTRATAKEKCAFWNRSEGEIQSAVLRGWAHAKRLLWCDAADADADAARRGEEKAAQEQATRRVNAQDAAAQDEEAWQAARPTACREPADERACDGVRSYLASYPQGRHAGEGRAQLAQAEPRIADLRARREILDGRARSNEAQAGVALSRVTMALQDPSMGSVSAERYVVVTLDATVSQPQPPLSAVWARASCAVGDKWMVDESGDFSDDLGDLNVGETKAVRLALFTTSPLRQRPRKCEIWLGVNHGQRSAAVIRAYCYVPGSRVQHGPCDLASASAPTPAPDASPAPPAWSASPLQLTPPSLIAPR